MVALTKRSKKSDEAVLEYLRNHIGRAQAARCAGYSPRTLYNYIQQDAEFAGLVKEAEDELTEKMKESARVRAFDGYDNGKGALVCSDPLAMFFIKQRDPSFRERYDFSSTDGTMTPAAPVTIMLAPLQAKPDSE